ncbi:MAG: ribonuclease HII [Candidatus Zambryskibacteria bacterium]|nr:ribonuclease HII [Candidatus Zambryskibacteria bacterium]
MQYIVGVDEAGRGPLAGPVAIGAVKIPLNFNRNFFKSIKDSKKLSSVDRELWFQLALEARRKGALDFAVSLVSERVIDRRGISRAIRLGIKRCLDKLQITDKRSQIFLDGSLKAPEEFNHQLTVIKGDEKIPVISLASIMAKVTRDRKMVGLSKRFPEFNFHIHKGYGTLMHRLAIKKYGSTVIHRQSFLKHLTKNRYIV